MEKNKPLPAPTAQFSIGGTFYPQPLSTLLDCCTPHLVDDVESSPNVAVSVRIHRNPGDWPLCVREVI